MLDDEIAEESNGLESEAPEITSSETVSTTSLDPPAAETAEAAVKRVEMRLERLQQHSELRTELQNVFSERYQEISDFILETQNSMNTEKVG